MERPGSAAPDAFAVPPPPPVGDLFDFAGGGEPAPAPATPGAAPPPRPPEWERGRPFLSGEFLVQARAPPGGSAGVLGSLRSLVGCALMRTCACSACRILCGSGSASAGVSVGGSTSMAVPWHSMARRCIPWWTKQRVCNH